MLPRCKNKWRTLFMGPAQPWHYKMGEANLFCLRQSGPHTARLRCRAPALMWGHPRKRPPLLPTSAVHAHPTKLTPRGISLGRATGDLLRKSLLCPELGLRERRKSSNSNIAARSQPSAGGSGSGPTYSTLCESYRQTIDVATEQHRGRGREIISTEHG